MMIDLKEIEDARIRAEKQRAKEVDVSSKEKLRLENTQKHVKEQTRLVK